MSCAHFLNRLTPPINTFQSELLNSSQRRFPFFSLLFHSSSPISTTVTLASIQKPHQRHHPVEEVYVHRKGSLHLATSLFTQRRRRLSRTTTTPGTTAHRRRAKGQESCVSQQRWYADTLSRYEIFSAPRSGQSLGSARVPGTLKRLLSKSASLYFISVLVWSVCTV